MRTRSGVAWNAGSIEPGRASRSASAGSIGHHQPFRSYGDGERARRRVLDEAGRKEPRPDDDTLDNLIAMFHRFESDEIGGARVKASFGGQDPNLTSDEEGYIEAAFDGLGVQAALCPDLLMGAAENPAANGWVATTAVYTVRNAVEEGRCADG